MLDAHEARQATNLCTGDGVALNEAWRTARACSPLERLLRFADFGALEMANFERDFFKRGGDERRGR